MNLKVGRMQRVVAAILILAGVVVNKWSVALILAPDGAITSTRVLVVIVAFQIGLIGSGLLLSRYRIGFSAVLVPLSGAGALVLSEIAVRQLIRFPPAPRNYVGEFENRVSRNFEVDSLTGWRMRPRRSFRWEFDGVENEYRSNSQGMRDPGEFASDCGAERLVLIGDSFAFGTGVAFDETMGAQLKDSLGPPVEVADLAMPGFGMDQMWMSLRHRGLALCPVLAVVVFIDDDWDRSLVAFRTGEGMNKPTFVQAGDSLRRATVTDRPNALVRFLDRRSVLWRVLVANVTRVAARWNRGDWWRVNVSIMEAMRRDAARANARILFVRVPRRDDWNSFPLLRTEMKRVGADYLDLADPMHRRSDVHLRSDGHLNALGHAWVAGEVARWVRERPSSPPGSVRP